MTFVLVTSQTHTYYAKYIYLSARLNSNTIARSGNLRILGMLRSQKMNLID